MKIYVSGYDEAGERVATALEQSECWTFNEVDGVVLAELPSLQSVLDRMRGCGAILLLSCPHDLAHTFVARVADHLRPRTTTNLGG